MQATRSTWVNLQELSEPTPQLEQAGPALAPLITQIIHNRGIAPDELARFLRPSLSDTADPLCMRGMRQALARLHSARAGGESVAVYGDFDVDGITGTAVLVEAFRSCGIRAAPYIPDRQIDGTNLRRQVIEDLAAQGVSLVETVDCGITSVEEIAQVKACGLDVIVTDHHSPPDVLPVAEAIVDPRQPGCAYPFKDLAGVGVAFKLAQALLRSVLPRTDSLELSLLDLVAIGSIADMVPLRGENRALVWHGLRALNETSRVGLQCLIARSGLQRGAISATDVGFRICPRLNAAGRLDHASLGYELLTASSYVEADTLAQRLEEKNSERQHLTQRMMALARETIAQDYADGEPRLLVLRIEPWATGVMGLVAGKLVEEFGRPVVVMHEIDGEVRGSARGTASFDVLAALRANADLLHRFGGHQLAAGFMAAASDMRALEERLHRRARDLLQDADVRPTLEIDAEVSMRQLTWQLLDQLQSVEPCGVGNRLPLFLCRHLKLLDFRCVGNNHLRLTVGRGAQRMTALVFRRGDLARYLRRNSFVDLVFYLEANEWNGYRTLQLRVRDMSFEPGYAPEPEFGVLAVDAFQR